MKNYLRAGAALLCSIALFSCDNTGTTKPSNTVINGVDGPNVSVTNGYVVMNFVFTAVTIDAGVTVPIEKFDGSSIYVGPDFTTGGTLLQVSILATDFFSGQNLALDPQTLPGGRLLPTVSGGSLPSIAVTVPQLNNTVLYIGKEVLGFFVPYSGLDLAGTIVSSNFYNAASTKVGTLSLVGSDANKENSGILLLLSPSLLGIESYRPAIQ